MPQLVQLTEAAGVLGPGAEAAGARSPASQAAESEFQEKTTEVICSEAGAGAGRRLVSKSRSEAGLETGEERSEPVEDTEDEEDDLEKDLDGDGAGCDHQTSSLGSFFMDRSKGASSSSRSKYSPSLRASSRASLTTSDLMRVSSRRSSWSWTLMVNMLLRRSRRGD